MQFKIPKQFELLGQTVAVEFTEDLQHDKDAYGAANFRSNKIQLQRSSKHVPLTADKLEHVFFHELAHYLMYVMGQDELMANEPFIDMMGGLMYQAIKSSKGELKY